MRISSSMTGSRAAFLLYLRLRTSRHVRATKMQWKRKTALGGDGVGQTSVWREGGWEGIEGEARAAAAADQIARTTGHGSSKRWKKDSTGAVRHIAHRLDLLCGVAVPSARNAAAVCFPGWRLYSENRCAKSTSSGDARDTALSKHHCRFQSILVSAGKWSCHPFGMMRSRLARM